MTERLTSWIIAHLRANTGSKGARCKELVLTEIDTLCYCLYKLMLMEKGSNNLMLQLQQKIEIERKSSVAPTLFICQHISSANNLLRVI